MYIKIFFITLLSSAIRSQFPLVRESSEWSKKEVIKVIALPLGDVYIELDM